MYIAPILNETLQRSYYYLIKYKKYKYIYIFKMKISLAVFKLSSLFKIFHIIPYQLLLLSCIDCVCTYIFNYNFILFLSSATQKFKL